ncbi:hypothetical protein L1887_35406 [Cichorium endivia]|nr:hypothetical protein L1887_35406 [Cichorium endivia]
MLTAPKIWKPPMIQVCGYEYEGFGGVYKGVMESGEVGARGRRVQNGGVYIGSCDPSKSGSTVWPNPSCKTLIAPERAGSGPLIGSVVAALESASRAV